MKDKRTNRKIQVMKRIDKKELNPKHVFGCALVRHTRRVSSSPVLNFPVKLTVTSDTGSFILRDNNGNFE